MEDIRQEIDGLKSEGHVSLVAIVTVNGQVAGDISAAIISPPYRTGA